MAKEHDYSSTQVHLPPKHAKAIQDYAADINPDDLHETETNDDVPHITVKYGLHTDDHRDVEKILEPMAPARATLGTTSLFENDDKDYDVLKIDVASDDLAALNKAVADGTEHTDTFPEYHPHATVAYLKKGRGKNYVGQDVLGKIPATVNFDTVHFSGKDGRKVPISLTGDRTEQAITHAIKAGDDHGTDD